jgi:hypothetical protein
MPRSNTHALAPGQRSARGSRGVVAATTAFAAARVLLGNPRNALAAVGTLLVYLHVSVKQRAFQGLLAAGLPGVTATTVGRMADFERALQDGPDAVLTLPIVLGAKGLAPGLQGRARGSAEERYALLAAGAVPEPSGITSVGALDILGREGTNQFVKKLVGPNVRVERVTKVEDLLPLLQMQRVETVLLPARLVAELRGASRLPLSDRELQTTVGLPAVASNGANGRAVLAAVSKMPADLSRLLGVQEWR